MQFLMFFVMLGMTSVSLAKIVVIGNQKLSFSTLTRSQVKSLYLKKIDTINKDTLYVFDQPYDSDEFDQFYNQVFKWSVSEVMNYWSKVLFRGDAVRPSLVTGDVQAIATVVKYPTAIAYIDDDSLKSSPGASAIQILYGGNDQVTDSSNDTASTASAKDFKTLLLEAQSQSSSIDPSISSSRNDNVNQSTADVSDSTLDGHSENTDNADNSVGTASSYSTSPTDNTTTASTPVINPDGSTYLDQSIKAHSVWSDIVSQYGVVDDSIRSKKEVINEVNLIVEKKDILMGMFKNSTPYIAYIAQQVRRHGLPSEIALLPFVESGYDPFAYSKVGASGLWQMMPETATSFNLSINWWYDQRRDVYASTSAAINDFLQLHSLLNNDWLLALAAYNSGVGTVKKAINRSKKSNKATDFWSLSLPSETKNYVPKLLAIAIIIESPEQYGITLPDISDDPYFDSVRITSQMSLGEISKLSGASIDEIRSLNPGMRRWATEDNNTYYLLLPSNSIKTFQDNLKSEEGKVKTNWQYHEVYKNETIASVASDYKTTEDIIMKANGLSDGDKLTVGQGLLVPIHLNQLYSTADQQVSSSITQSVNAVTSDSLLSGAGQVTANDSVVDQGSSTNQAIFGQSNMSQVDPNQAGSDQSTSGVVTTLSKQTSEQISQLKLNDDGSQATPSTDNISDLPVQQDDSLKSLVDKIYNSKSQ